MAQKKIDIKINVDDKSVKIAGEETMRLSQQVRVLKAELASGKYSQEEFEVLATKLGDVQDKMAQTTARSGDLLTSLQLIPGPIGEIASKFNGAVALLKQFSGFSLKDLKFQFRETLNDVKDIGKGLAEATGLSALFGKSVIATKEGMDAVGEGVKAATTQVGNFRKALITTGIGALVVAVGLLVAYWDDIVGLVNGVSSEQEELNALTQENLDIEKKKLSDLDGQTNQLKLQGKSEKEILQLKIQQGKQAIAAAEASLAQAEITKKAQVEAAQRNKDILAGILNFASLPLTMILGSIDLISEGLVKLGILSEATTLREDLFDWTASFVFDPEEVAKEGEATVQASKDTLNGLKEQVAGYQLAVQDIEKQGAEKRSENKKESDNKRIEAEKVLADAELQLKSKKDQELAAVETDYQDKLRKLREGGLVDDGNLKELYEKKKQDINDKYAAETLKKQQDLENQLRKIETSRTDTLMDDAQVEIDIVNQKYTALIDAAKKNGEDITLLQKLQAAEVAKIRTDAQKAENEELRNLQDKQYQDMMSAAEGDLELQQQILDEKIRLDEEYYAKQLAIEGLTAEQIKAIRDKQTADMAANAQAQISIEQKKFEAQQQLLGATGAAIEALADIVGKNTKAGKALAVAASLINTYTAIAGALAQYSKPGSPPIPGYAIVQAVATGLVGFKAVSDIIKTPLPGDGGGSGGSTGSGTQVPRPRGMATGGLVVGIGGPKSDLIPAMLSNGESVINAKSTAMFRPLLSSINSIGGGKRFADGGLAVGSFSQDQALLDLQNSLTLNQQPIKTYVVASDMTSQQMMDRNIKTRSTI